MRITSSQLEVPPLPPIVLVVDRDADSRRMYDAALDTAGLWVASAEDARDALEYAAELRPDAILADIGLPGGVNGIELARSLSENPRTRGIPIVAVAGSKAQRLGQDAALFSRVLVKPVAPDRLVGALTTVIERFRALKDRARRAGRRVPALFSRAQSRRTGERLERAVESRPCPACSEPLEWAERRRLDGLLYDYYRPCRNGCGLFYYDHLRATLVALF